MRRQKHIELYELLCQEIYLIDLIKDIISSHDKEITTENVDLIVNKILLIKSSIDFKIDQINLLTNEED